MRESRVTAALQGHADGMNCAQAVAAAYAPDYGIPPQEALRMTAGYGAGFHAGALCGAAAGAVLVLGLAFGEDKRLCNVKTTDFMRRFRTDCGALDCRELRVGKTPCAQLVEQAARLLEQLLE